MNREKETRQEWVAVAQILIVVYAASIVFALTVNDQADQFQNEAVSILAANDIPLDKNADLSSLTASQKEIFDFYQKKYEPLQKTASDYLNGLTFGLPFLLFFLYGIILIVLGNFSPDGQYLKWKMPSVKTSFMLSLLSIFFGGLGSALSRYNNVFDTWPILRFIPTVIVGIVFSGLIKSVIIKKKLH